MLAIIDPVSILGIILAGSLLAGKAARDGRAARDLERARIRAASTRRENSGRIISAPASCKDVRSVDFGTFPVAPWLRERGWTHEDGVYRGYFVSKGHRLRGEVHYRAGEFELLFHRPPSWATEGEHSACWRDRPSGWKLLHLNSSPGNVVEAIVGCQAFLERKLQENVA